MSTNVVWHSHPVDQQVRAEQKSQQSLVIWFTGSGVTEAVNQLLEHLYSVGALKAGYAPIAGGT